MTAWNKPGRPLILASASPRRKDILARMGFTFTVVKPLIGDEQRFFNGRGIGAAVRALALAKARSIAGRSPGALVFAGDTVVCVGKRVMGKPKSREDARRMIAALSGKTHEVYSGVALVCPECGFEKAGSARTKVTFRRLGRDEIDAYLADETEYRDKAGAYAIQGKAMRFIDKIDGCFYNVVGLPVAETLRLFKLYARHGLINQQAGEAVHQNGREELE